MEKLHEIVAKKAMTYKKKVASSFMLVEGARLTEKVTGEDFYVTKKLDGVMQIVNLSPTLPNKGGSVKVTSYSKSGMEYEGLPCLDEFGKLCEKAGVKSAIIAAELYVLHEDGKRERVGEVSTAIANFNSLSPVGEGRGGVLCLAPFDILEIDGESFLSAHYRDTLKKLREICRGGSLVKPVESREASSRSEVAEIYREWVEEGGAEGIVVHSELPIIYKVKPKHTVDAAIVGYTVRDEFANQVRDLAFAMQREDGLWQIIGTSGNGLSDQMREDLFSMLVNEGAETDYFMTDSRGVAFKMVKPRIVVELSAIDFVTENAACEPKMNPLLSLNYFRIRGLSESTQTTGEVESDSAVSVPVWQSYGTTAGVAAQHLVVERLREDKTHEDQIAETADVRISQLTDIASFAEIRERPLAELPKSEMIARKVFYKGSGEKLMVQKFIVFKTNKQDSGRFPAYVFHYTNYSCSRQEPLKKDLRVSSSYNQIMQIYDQFISENIKKGWMEVSQL